ncbi:hypothetical protein NDU88_002457 [Pleurodeles waltl]|uniref:Uncharacterized protein n=1 Tax=Pleurodeles waltl TaxID=8319 RepID=A0AAV7KVG1_PLEWA|nr:hypothetical protein NDU88_002457 [Pleurodeles waltl]
MERSCDYWRQLKKEESTRGLVGPASLSKGRVPVGAIGPSALPTSQERWPTIMPPACWPPLKRKAKEMNRETCLGARLPLMSAVLLTPQSLELVAQPPLTCISGGRAADRGLVGPGHLPFLSPLWNLAHGTVVSSCCSLWSCPLPWLMTRPWLLTGSEISHQYAAAESSKGALHVNDLLALRHKTEAYNG